MSTETGCGSWGWSSSDCSSEGHLHRQTQLQGDLPGQRPAWACSRRSLISLLTSLTLSNSPLPAYKVQGGMQEPRTPVPKSQPLMCVPAPRPAHLA